MSPTARRIAGAAALIAVLTVASRVVGFGRVLVFTWAVGYSDLGAAYQTANTIPNILFEIVAGGALASLVVPLLAGPIARGDRQTVSRLSSALLTWTLALLVPLAVVLALAAEPVMGLLANQASPEMVATGTRMLRVFAIQLPLYGVGIVLTGVLQAHHRFGWPALAPLLSSVTVMGAYLLFTVVDARGADLATVSRAGELVLSVGTTAGVAVLTLCLLIPLVGLGVRMRPALRLDHGVRAQAGALALAGAVTLGAQQLVLGLVIYLANGPVPEGTLVVYTVAQTVFLLPWAVLAVPVATSTFPTLAAAGATGDSQRYRRTLATAVRVVLLLTLLGAAALVALAEPAGRVLGAIAARNPSQDALAAGIAGLGPGLVGYGLFALLSRALYARGDTGLAAWVTVLGWGSVALATVAASLLMPDRDRVLALAVGNSVGMTLLGAALLVAVVRRAGRAAVAGALRTGFAGLLAAVLACAAGLGVGALFGRTPGTAAAATQGMLCGVTVLIVFVAVVVVVDRRDVRSLLGRSEALP